MTKIKHTVTERAMPVKNQFRIPQTELDKYVEVVVMVSAKECKASCSISFPRETEKYGKNHPEIVEATKKALDLAKGNLLEYMKDRGITKKETEAKF